MQKKIILCSSITYALKGKKILIRKGFSAYIIRTPTALNECGCGYCILINQNDEKDALKLLLENGVKVKGTEDYINQEEYVNYNRDEGVADDLSR